MAADLTATVIFISCASYNDPKNTKTFREKPLCERKCPG